MHFVKNFVIMKSSSTIKYMVVLTESFQNTNADLGKGTVLRNASLI